MEYTQAQKRGLKIIRKILKDADRYAEKEAKKTRINLEDFYNEHQDLFDTRITKKGDTIVTLKDATIRTQYRLESLKYYEININDLEDIKHI